METVLLILLAFGGLTGIGVAGVFGLTLVGRIKSTPTDSALARRLAELEERFGETETLVAQLSGSDQQLRDLEERVEFMERLLQQERHRDRLPPPE